MQDLNEMFSLEGKVFFVTGGAGLLGAIFVEALLKADADVIAVDIDAEGLQRLDKKLPKTGGRLETAVCDICNEQQVIRLIDEGASSLKNKEIFGLINSAALDPKVRSDGRGQGAFVNSSTFTAYPVDSWRRSLEVNLTGAFVITQAVCRHLEGKSCARGSIVNISSTYGLVGPDQRIYPKKDGVKHFKPLDYSVTKAGIHGFTKALSSYYRETEIRVNTLTPGGAWNNQDNEFVQLYADRTILGRMAEPGEYAGAILFLCSEASSYMTGSNLVVDGGWTAV